MKRLLLFLACAITAVCQPNRIQLDYDDLASLLASTVQTWQTNLSANIACRSTPNDGGGGEFYFAPGSTAATNLGTIFTSTGVSGRWFRKHSGQLNVNWFGATGNGVTDDTVSLQSAFDVARSTNLPWVIFLPPGTNKITASLNLTKSRFGTGYDSIFPTIIRGSGRYSTMIRGGENGYPVLDCIGLNNVQMEDFAIESNLGGGNYATAAILVGRHGTLTNGARASLQRISVEGFYSVATLVDVGVEICEYNHLTLKNRYVGDSGTYLNVFASADYPTLVSKYLTFSVTGSGGSTVKNLRNITFEHDGIGAFNAWCIKLEGTRHVTLDNPYFFTYHATNNIILDDLADGLTIRAASTEYQRFGILNLTQVGTTVTCTTDVAHLLSDGMTVEIYNASNTAYNGSFVVTVTGGSEFQYTALTAPGADELASAAVYGVSGNGLYCLTGHSYQGINIDSASRMRPIVAESGCNVGDSVFECYLMSVANDVTVFDLYNLYDSTILESPNMGEGSRYFYVSNPTYTVRNEDKGNIWWKNGITISASGGAPRSGANRASLIVVDDGTDNATFAVVTEKGQTNVLSARKQSIPEAPSVYYPNADTNRSYIAHGWTVGTNDFTLMATFRYNDVVGTNQMGIVALSVDDEPVTVTNAFEVFLTNTRLYARLWGDNIANNVSGYSDFTADYKSNKVTIAVSRTASGFSFYANGVPLTVTYSTNGTTPPWTNYVYGDYFVTGLRTSYYMFGGEMFQAGLIARALTPTEITEINAAGIYAGATALDTDVKVWQKPHEFTTWWDLVSETAPTTVNLSTRRVVPSAIAATSSGLLKWEPAVAAGDAMPTVTVPTLCKSNVTFYLYDGSAWNPLN